MEKKPYKSGGDFARDGNGNVLKLSKREVLTRFKRMCKNQGWCGLKNYYVNDFGTYWTTSAN